MTAKMPMFTSIRTCCRNARKKIRPAVMVFAFPLLLWSCQEQKSITVDGDGDTPLFTLLTPSQTGISFRNTIVDTADLTLYDSDLIYSGAGVAAGDINNDGLPDLFLASNQHESKLYLNKGDFKFEDVTEGSGIFRKGWTSGATMADINGDGWLDIYVCVGGFKQEPDKRNLLFINNGDATFTERAAEYGLDDNGVSSMASFFDYDNDGDLDVFVVNYPDNIAKTFEVPFYLNPQMVDTVNCNQLYEQVDGKFINVTERAGIHYRNADGFNVSVADINQDGFLDMYVNVDLLQPDFFYINNGDKTFTESTNDFFNLVPLFSMGSTFSDVNNDGLMDLIASEMMPPDHHRRKNNMPHPDVEFYEYVLKDKFNSQQRSRNMLQIQNPDGSFSEMGEMANISRTDWSWATLSVDFDNDQYKDLLITNGVKRDMFDQTYLSLAFDGNDPQVKKYSHEGKELIHDYPVFLPMNYVYRNNGDLTYTDMRKPWGFQQKAASQGAVYADFDQDGYPDIVVSNTDSLVSIYRNNGASLYDRHYLKVMCSGEGMNTFGLGAKVWVYYPGGVQYQEMMNAQGWQSSSEPILFYGLGDVEVIDSLRIRWLSGKEQVLKQVKADQTIRLAEREAVKTDRKPNILPGRKLFTAAELKGISGFRHQESDFIDFRRDKMIPKMMSREGPGMAVGDLNNDGMEDLFIGGAAGQSGALFLQKLDGSFEAMKGQPWEKDAAREDMGIAFFDLNSDGYDDIYIASGSNEFYPGDPLLQDRVYLNRKGKGFDAAVLPALPKTSTGVVRVLDIDGDGDEDLFIGGRIRNADYPLTPDSYILENDGGKLVNATAKWCPEFAGVGMVTDLKLADMNNDGIADLVVAGEWMPIKLFIREGKRYVDRSAEWGLDKTNGWWNSITIADFDNNGRLDILGGNYGQNSVLQCSVEEPLVCYMSDFDHNGTNEPILCYYKYGMLAPYADRDLLTRTLPSFTNKFLTYDAYGKATVEDVFTKSELEKATVFYTYILENSMFWNRNNRLEREALPREAQVAPIYGTAIYDYDQDGHQDVFLTGNSYSSFYEEGPMAALRGLLLTVGDDGSLSVLRSDVTGISVNKDMKSTTLLYLRAEQAFYQVVASNNNTVDVFRCNRQIKVTDRMRQMGGYLSNYNANKGDYATVKAN